MKSLFEEHRIKREKAIEEHKQNELLRLKQEKQAWFNHYKANMASWHENYEPDLDTCINRLWWQNFCISPQELINNEIQAIQAIKRPWGGVVIPAYYFSPMQFEYTQQAKNLEDEKLALERLELERIKVEQLEIERLEAERLHAEKLKSELGIEVNNNHDFVEVQLHGSFHDEYF